MVVLIGDQRPPDGVDDERDDSRIPETNRGGGELYEEKLKRDK
jgi:hypothetical protein